MSFLIKTPQTVSDCGGLSTRELHGTPGQSEHSTVLCRKAKGYFAVENSRKMQSTIPVSNFNRKVPLRFSRSKEGFSIHLSMEKRRKAS